MDNLVKKIIIEFKLSWLVFFWAICKYKAEPVLIPKVVYIYNNEGMVEGSPFVSYSSAHKALGLNPSSNTCNRYIDTGRLYKNTYIFSSNPIDRTSRD